MWQCPLCQTPIALVSNVIKCANHHSFDKAKAGYVNLLPVQFKKSKAPGDDKNMVRARREFHQQQGYAPLKQKMVSLLAQHANTESQPFVVYDAGCGEGSYLAACVTGLNQQGIRAVGAGSDISKVAVELAAKAYKNQQFVVASSYDLPLQDESVDAAIQVFAPGSSEEYARVLKPSGLLMTVDPAPEHLFELKSLVYDTPEAHKVASTARTGFTLLNAETLRFSLPLVTEAQRIALIKMTPYYWSLPEQKLHHIVQQLTEVTADFNIQLFRKSTRESQQ